MSVLVDSVKTYFEDLEKGCNNLIDCETLYKKIGAKEEMFILDIRKAKHFNKGHIEGAIHSEWVEVWDFINEEVLPKDEKIIVVCYSGQISGQVVSILKILGYDACSLVGGMINGWNKGDMPIEAGCST